MLKYKVQEINFRDKIELYRSYMPFIKNGGIFIPFNSDITPNNIVAQEIIWVILSLPGVEDKVTVKGQVAWINRNGANKGFGLSMTEATQNSIQINIKDMIEKITNDPALRKENRYTF